jgi:hypothetical protein
VVRAGLGLVAAGLIQASAGEATTVTRTLTIIFPTVITPWLIQMGILHGLLVDGRGEVRARPAGRARSPCRRRCPHRVTLVIGG